MKKYKLIVSFETNPLDENEIDDVIESIKSKPYISLNSYGLIDHCKSDVKIKEININYFGDKCNYFRNSILLSCIHSKNKSSECIESMCPLQDE